MRCPCGSTKNYNECCQVYHDGLKLPETAEQLMRSRYSAFHQRKFDYIVDTQLPPAADHFNLQEAIKDAANVKWTRLEVINANTNSVEFRAHYRIQSKHYIMHEISQFRQENGKWYYIDGMHVD